MARTNHPYLKPKLLVMLHINLYKHRHAITQPYYIKIVYADVKVNVGIGRDLILQEVICDSKQYGLPVYI